MFDSVYVRCLNLSPSLRYLTNITGNSRPAGKRIFETNEEIPGQGKACLGAFKRLKLSPYDIDEFYLVFCKVDRDFSGEIDIEEFYLHCKLRRSPFSDKVFLLLGTPPSIPYLRAVV
jgi:hypothetical protein